MLKNAQDTDFSPNFFTFPNYNLRLLTFENALIFTQIHFH